jgi:X-Pro dipeptidyl-peptidase
MMGDRRPLSLALVALLAGATLAGCLSAQLSPLRAADDNAPSAPVYNGTATTLLRVPLTTKDGARLDIVANLSEAALQAGAKLPVIVDIGPYYSTGIMDYTAIDQRMADYFVPRGYVMARAALRGTGESTGCFDLGGKQEQQDVHDVVEWLGTRPWSNGNVAVFGKSYDGTTPWEAAITQPSHLKTIVPISGITDMYRYTFYEGAVYPEEVAFEPYYYLYVGDDVSVPGPDGGPPAWTGNEKTLLASLNPCEPVAFEQQSQADGASTLTGDHGDPFWLERDYELQWSKIQVPVFDVHGMQDWNVKLDNEVPMFNALHVPKAAWFGQWEHNYPDVDTFNANWSRHDWNETLLTWFDHWLKGKDNDWQRVAHVEAQDQSGNWSVYPDDAWPPGDAKALSVTLTSPTATFNDPLGKGFDPATQANGVGFVSEPMPANVTLLGRPSLDVTLSVDRPDANLAVALYDVDPSGKWTEVDHGVEDLRHHASRDAGSWLAPGQEIHATVWLYPQELVLAKGHRLGLSIGAELPKWYEPAPLSQGATFTLDLARSELHVDARADGAAAFWTAAAGLAPPTGATAGAAAATPPYLRLGTS